MSQNPKKIENDEAKGSTDEKNSDPQKSESIIFSSKLNDFVCNENNYENKYKLDDHLVLTMDDDTQENNSNGSYFAQTKSIFIHEESSSNRLNKSNAEGSNLDDLKLNNLNSIRNNLNEFNQNFKNSNQKDKINNYYSSKSNSMENLNIRSNTHHNQLIQAEHALVCDNSKATILNRYVLSCSSSLSSSYSNINSNPVKLSNSDESSSNSITNHFELKFDSLSSIEDNSKFNLNTNALSDSTLLISTNYQNETNSGQNHSKEQAHIWTESEAYINQFDQVGPSACGATAILNVLKALNYEFDFEKVCSEVKVNSRIPESSAHKTTLADYLFSRTIAGMNSSELIKNIERSSDGNITGRHFSFYPARDINLAKWLANWMRKGAVPVALLNLQKSPVWGFVPDAWHYQMIYACDSDSVYLTNPLESKPIDLIMNELTSDSVLLVRSCDVVKRFNANNSNLVDLLLMKNHSVEEKKRWFNMNVLGQVINILREHKIMNENNILSKGVNQPDGIDLNVSNSLNSGSLNVSQGAELVDNVNLNNSAQQVSSSNLNTTSNKMIQCLSHITIPASYKAGITLFAYKDSALFKEIIEEKDLQLI